MLSDLAAIALRGRFYKLAGFVRVAGALLASAVWTLWFTLKDGHWIIGDRLYPRLERRVDREGQWLERGHSFHVRNPLTGEYRWCYLRYLGNIQLGQGVALPNVLEVGVYPQYGLSVPADQSFSIKPLNPDQYLETLRRLERHLATGEEVEAIEPVFDPRYGQDFVGRE